MIKIIKDSKIIDAIRLQEEVIKVDTILRNKMIAKDEKYLCKAYPILNSEEMKEFGLSSRTSDLAKLLARAKEYYKL